MRKILLVIDMQNDFIDGALGTKEAVAIVPKVVDEIKKYNSSDIFLTADTHFENYLETQEGKNLPVPHCIKNTKGLEINSDVLSVVGSCGIFEKNGFGCPKLAEELCKIKEPFQIEIIGLCTDICVISNAFLIKSLLPEVKISVKADCCAGVTPDSHKNALSAMSVCQIEIIGE